MHCNKTASFDHPVGGAGKQRRWHGEAEHPGGLGVDDQTWRTPLTMMDSLQRDARKSKRSGVVRDPMGRVESYEEWHEENEDCAVVDAYGNPAGYRPGSVHANDAPTSNAHAAHTTNKMLADEAYAQSITALQDAWKPRTPAGAYPLSAGEGTACTIDGAPGTLKRQGDGLVCVPNRQDSTVDARDAAYEESVRALESAWKS
jgi:hypothetical protein